MHYRQARLSDYDALHAVRMAVKENALVNTNLVTYGHYRDMLEQNGRGWVCEDSVGRVAGFAIVDLNNNNIWALFLHPDFERQGIGQKLHQLMLDWSFEQGIDNLWLTTDPGTRAERFYLKAGWQSKGLDPNGEHRFEMTKSNWLQNRKKQ